MVLELASGTGIAMPSPIEQSHHVLEHDVDPDFLATVAKNLGWEYPLLFEEIASDSLIPLEMKPEAYAKRRSDCATKALVAACEKHGVPYELRRLACNGQRKLLVKIGRVVIIQEPMLERDEEPRASDFKRELVAATGFVEQYELDFGGHPQRIRDWTGSVVTVLLHAPAGPKFTLEHRSLGAIMLGLPNDRYDDWLMRLDLHRIALFGFDAEADGVFPMSEKLAPAVQKDEVRVKLRRKSKDLKA